MRFSETALDVLLQAVRDANLANGRCLRLVPSNGGYALTIDTPSGWDTVLRHEGKSFLIVTKEVEESLSDAVIEAKEDDGAFQLIVRKEGAEGERREVA